jgi:hypothetical protein
MGRHSANGTAALRGALSRARATAIPVARRTPSQLPGRIGPVRKAARPPSRRTCGPSCGRLRMVHAPAARQPVTTSPRQHPKAPGSRSPPVPPSATTTSPTPTSKLRQRTKIIAWPPLTSKAMTAEPDRPWVVRPGGPPGIGCCSIRSVATVILTSDLPRRKGHRRAGRGKTAGRERQRRWRRQAEKGTGL